MEKINDELEKNLIAMQAIIGQKESLTRIMNMAVDKLPDSVMAVGEKQNKR